MTNPSERLDFFVQGSANDPYKVSFWRVGDDLKSSCTCQAGKNGLACKHRLNLLDGDLTNLVSSLESFSKLQKMIDGSDVGVALRAKDEIIPLLPALENLLPLKPPGRRKSTPPDLLIQFVIQGGLIKGNQSYYDVFDSGLSYVGSVKVKKGTVFSEIPSDYFLGITLTVKRLTDGLVWEKSQSVYAAANDSPMSMILLGGLVNSSQQKKLKRALVD